MSKRDFSVFLDINIDSFSILDRPHNVWPGASQSSLCEIPVPWKPSRIVSHQIIDGESYETSFAIQSSLRESRFSLKS